MSRLKDPRVLRLIVSVVAILALMVLSRLYLPVPLPHIQLPAEVIPGLPAVPIPLLGPLAVTNTMIAILITDVLLVGLAVLATRRLSMVPGRLQSVFEAVIEWWRDQSVQMIGEENTKRWLPLVLTVFLLIVASNWSELVPAYDSVGVLFQPAHAEGEDAKPHTLFEVAWTGEEGRSFGMATSRIEPDEADAGRGAGGHGSDDEGLQPHGWAFVPFLRVAASDLNFTLALAIICFIAIEIVGLQANGLGYLRKFINIDFRRGPFMGFLNIFVGLLELVSEVARVISFSFRLFGNIFAGQTLLFVIPFLIPLGAVVMVYGLEMFVGMIQGFVFSILTLAFMAVAVVTHGEGEHH